MDSFDNYISDLDSHIVDMNSENKKESPFISLLNKNKETCKKYALLHNTEYNKYSKIQSIFNFGNIFITSIVGALSVYINGIYNTPENIKDIINNINSGILGIGAILSIFQEKYNFGVKSQEYKEMVTKFESLEYQIENYLTGDPIYFKTLYTCTTNEIKALINSPLALSTVTVDNILSIVSPVKESPIDIDENTFNTNTVKDPNTSNDLIKKKMEYDLQRYIKNTFE